MHRLAASLIALLCIGSTSAAQAPVFDVVEKSITELDAALAAGTVTSRQLTEMYLARIEAYDQRGPSINAMIALNPRARDEAAALDRERAFKGARGPLHGIPVVIKDNYETVDLPTTAGSVALKGSIAGSDAFQVRKLREAGVVIVGKTNLHEFARGITTISSLGGQTRNPYDPTRNPGGSSGGTGAAVAANFAAVGMGSDTCGSIRYPSAHNSLVGLRPTLGLSSRTGIIPLSHSQDVGGPLGRTVRDVAIVMDATVGPDPDDPVTRAGVGRYPSGPNSYVKSLDGATLRGARIGLLDALFGSAAEDQRVGSVIRSAIQEMNSLGAASIQVQMDDPPTNADGVGIIAHEFKFDLDAYLERTPKAPVRSLAEILDKHLIHASLENSLRGSADIKTLDTDAYRIIVARNGKLREALIRLMDVNEVSVLAYPTLRRTAAKIGEPQQGGNCAASAATGLPAITVPAGFADDGMPVGLELLGRPFSEVDLLRLAYAYELATLHRHLPALTPPLNAR